MILNKPVVKSTVPSTEEPFALYNSWSHSTYTLTVLLELDLDWLLPVTINSVGSSVEQENGLDALIFRSL